MTIDKGYSNVLRRMHEHPISSAFPTSSGEEHGRRCVGTVSVGTTSNREVINSGQGLFSIGINHKYIYKYIFIYIYI